MGTKAHRALEAKADGVRNGVKVQEKKRRHAYLDTCVMRHMDGRRNDLLDG